MPSKSKKQAKLMRAVAHGWKPSRIKGPTRTVAKEFVSADERRGEVDGYRYGGYAEEDEYYGGGPAGYDEGGPAEYQFGGMAGFNPIMRGAGRMMPGGRMPRGGVMGGQYRGVPPQRGALQQFMQQRGGGLHPGAQGPGGGFLSRFRQQTPGQPLHPGARGPGGGGFLSRFRQMQRGQPGGGRWGSPVGPGGPRVSELPRGGVMGGPPGTGGRVGTLGGPGYGRNPLGSAGPGGDLRRGPLSQFGGPGGGKPGRGIIPLAGQYPGGGSPNIRGRNPMMRGRGRFGGRGGMRR